MDRDRTVNEYRLLLKSLADQAAHIGSRQADDLGLRKKADGMVLIYRRILDLPPKTVWEHAVRRDVSLVDRVEAMREAADLLKRIAADPGADSRRLRLLIGGLPGDDPTSF